MLLQVRDLGIAYGKGDPVVRHVSFDLDAGQVLAIVGESGSGKTTVIRAIQHVLPGGGQRQHQTKDIPDEIREGSGNCGWCGVWSADE